MDIEDDYDFLADLDSVDHNNLYNSLQRWNLHKEGPLTIAKIAAVTGNWVLDIEGPRKSVLEQINNRMSENAPPTVTSPAQPAAKSDSDTKPKPEKEQPRPSQRTEESVFTTERIVLQTSSELNDFAEQERFIPPIISVILFLLVCLSTTGVMVSLKIPISLAISIGLAFGCFVPSLMPPQSNQFFLSTLSVFGWAIILFGGALSLDVTESPELVKFLVELSFPSILLAANFAALSLGVASFAITDDEKLWTRRVANNLNVLALCLFIAALIFDDLIDGLVPAIGAITGLWGIVVLGQSRPFDLGQIPERFAILCLFFSMATLFIWWSGPVFMFLVLSVLVVGLSLIAPTIPSEIQANILLAISAAGILSMSFVMTISWPSFIFHLSILLLVLIQMELRFRMMTTKQYVVKRILSPMDSTGVNENHIVDSDVAILGFKGAGKTSYLAALWMLLNHKITRELWYGSYGPLYDQRPLSFAIQDVKDILKEPLGEADRRMLDHEDEKQILQQFLSHRAAKFSMKDEFRTNKLPHPMAFPFIPSTPRDTKQFLESFSSKLSERERMSRSIPKSTSAVSKQLTVGLGFAAELHESYPTFFGLLKKQRSYNTHVEKRIRCLDVPGEEVERAVQFMEGQIFKSKSIANVLKNIEDRPNQSWQRHKEAIRYIVEMTAKFEHVVFLIDADEFTNPDKAGSSPVGAYLLLADQLAHLSGSSLRKISVLLNKSDTLLPRGDIPNRIMPGGGLSGWDDMLNREKALWTLAEVVGPAILSRISIPIEAYFTCTFGGVIPKIENSTAEDNFVPAYPMVPVNVLEPLLRDMMRESNRE